MQVTQTPLPIRKFSASKPLFVLQDNSASSSVTKEVLGTIDDQFIIIKKVGKGGTSKVYLGYDKSSKDKLYAFKVIKAPYSKVLESEHLILSQISDKNIIKSYFFSPNSKFIKSKKDSSPVNISFLKLEYMPYGELFEYVYYPRRGFGENLGRLIFHTLLLSMQSIHNSGIVHRDIKSENIMLDGHYNIKLCDFGFAAFNTGKFSNFLGTADYASPEICNRQSYYGNCNDIFSLGITIFVLVSGNMPFRMKNSADPCYNLIVNNKYEEYYMKRGLKLSESFKEMFNMMIAFQPEQRPSIEELLNCKWVKEGNYSKANYDLFKTEIKNRKKIVYSKKHSS